MTATTHINTATTRAPRATRGWMQFSAALTDIVPDLADRDDLTVSCAPGAGRGAPGCFLPNLGSIELDGHRLGVDPATCNPHRIGDRTRYAAMWGVLVHEAAHARHTRWTAHLTRQRGAHVEAAILLEESRIEAGQLRRRPADRRWLRSSATQIVMDGLSTSSATSMDAWQAAHTAALLLGRRDAGVFHAREVKDVEDLVLATLGASTLADLRAIWNAAHGTADDDHAAMLRLGRRWCKVLGVDPNKPSDPNAGQNQQGQGRGQAQGSSQPGQQGQPGQPGGEQAPKEPSPLEQAAQAAASRVAAAEDRASSAERKEAEKIARQIAEEQQAAKNAAKIFQQGAAAPGGSSKGPTRITGTRKPTTREQGAARALARLLRNAAHRERAVTVTTSATPPGRLRMRGALAADAQRAAGQIPTAEPFLNVHRRHVPNPPLRVGVLCDVSGSMQALAGPVASAAYILNKAVSHVTDSTAATAIFGKQVRAITGPGQNPTEVRQFEANDGSHAIGEAVQAVNIALGLDQPGAARLLVIISDGKYATWEREPAQKEVTRLIKSGCAVLWLALGEGATPFDGAQLVTLTDPAQAATAIGQGAIRALRAA
ncbi:vWA domain-containing protein [Nonomuraea sp. NPDC049646]|uniref:vWA domain-containing protein n=1 Tax=unclassified Nonomuraea TaxID=2593643 RepID=UPI0037A2CA50